MGLGLLSRVFRYSPLFHKRIHLLNGAWPCEYQESLITERLFLFGVVLPFYVKMPSLGAEFSSVANPVLSMSQGL